MMETKTVLFGVVGLLAGAGSVVGVTKYALVSQGGKDADAVTAIIADGELRERDCVKQLLNVDGVEKEGWLCDGGYNASQQNWLDEVSDKTNHVKLKMRENEAGEVIVDVFVGEKKIKEAKAK